MSFSFRVTSFTWNQCLGYMANHRVLRLFCQRLFLLQYLLIVVVWWEKLLCVLQWVWNVRKFVFGLLLHICWVVLLFGRVRIWLLMCCLTDPMCWNDSVYSGCILWMQTFILIVVQTFGTALLSISFRGTLHNWKNCLWKMPSFLILRYNLPTFVSIHAFASCCSSIGKIYESSLLSLKCSKPCCGSATVLCWVVLAVNFWPCSAVLLLAVQNFCALQSTCIGGSVTVRCWVAALLDTA